MTTMKVADILSTILPKSISPQVKLQVRKAPTMEFESSGQARIADVEERGSLLTRERYQRILELEKIYREDTYEYTCPECQHEWVPHTIKDWKCPACEQNQDVIFPSAHLRIETTSKSHIPILKDGDPLKEEPLYTFLYSNTDNAHAQGHTRDWVVVYAQWPDEKYTHKHTYTVVWTKNNQRVIAGIDMPEEG